jgi:hypothetical protein
MNYWELSRAHRGLLTGLMDQQLWCWGQDIEHHEGNALLEYGFTRIRPPQGQKACSQYSLNVGGGSMLRVWGYGIAYLTSTECCYFSRAAFSPALLKSRLPDAIFSCDELPPLKYSLNLPEKERCAGYVENVIREIHYYESWLQDRFGPEYREKSLANRKTSIPQHQQSIQEWVTLLGQATTALMAS